MLTSYRSPLSKNVSLVPRKFVYSRSPFDHSIFGKKQKFGRTPAKHFGIVLGILDDGILS
jgi:hypothetical protein